MTTPCNVSINLGVAALPQTLLVQGEQNEPYRIALLLAQARCQTPGMQTDLLASAFLQHSGRAVDDFNKADGLIARQALPLPLQPESGLGEIAREGVAKGGDLASRTQRLRRQR